MNIINLTDFIQYLFLIIAGFLQSNKVTFRNYSINNQVKVTSEQSKTDRHTEALRILIDPLSVSVLNVLKF